MPIDEAGVIRLICEIMIVAQSEIGLCCFIRAKLGSVVAV